MGTDDQNGEGLVAGLAEVRALSSKWKVAAVLLGLPALVALFFMYTEPGLRTQFMVGGALVNMGYRLQDHLESYDFEHLQDISPQDVWKEVLKQNEMSSRVRATFPRHGATSFGGSCGVHGRSD